MPRKTTGHGSTRSRNTKILLIALILLLIMLLCGLLYILRGVTNVPERTPMLTNPPGVELVWEAFGGGALGTMERPFDVAYDGEDTIYVTVPGERSILAFDADGRNGRVLVRDEPPADDERTLAEMTLSEPAGIDVGDDGLIYVADRRKMAIVVFSPQGEKVRELAFMGPKTVEVDGNRMYVCSDLSTVFVLDLQGNTLGQWGTYGREKEQLSDPMGAVADADGTIYVSDLGNYRVLALSPDLEYLWQYGGAAFTREEQDVRLISGPGGITLAGDGNMYVVDSLGSQVQVLDRSGESVAPPLGESGHNDDQFYFPTGIDWMDENLFVIADSMHNRIIGVRLTPQVESQ